MKRWRSDVADVRFDKTVNYEIHQFLREHKVRTVAMADRIMGCPHEEGIDYSEGEVCPQCPFWANRDRWTGETTD